MTVAKDANACAQEPMAWFQHDAVASQDQKCQRLLYRYGNEGYGMFWRLVELLASATGHALSLETDEDWLILANQIGIRRGGAFDEVQAVDDCREFVDCLLDIGLLTRDGEGRVESQRLQRNALLFGKRKAGGSAGGRPRKSKPESGKQQA